MERELRFDRATVFDVKENQFGFVILEAAITRTGVMPYKMPDGEIRKELKHPDEIFAADTMDSAKSVPVTDGHPLPMVNPKNYEKYLKGSTHLDVRKEGNLLVVSETIFDEDLIAYILSGKKRQISIGFDCIIKDEPGTFKGEEYDVKQTDIRINHIAHLEQGRAGETVGARLDNSIEDSQRYAVMDGDTININNHQEKEKRADYTPANPDRYSVSNSNNWEDIRSKLPALREMSQERKDQILHYFGWTSSSDIADITNKANDLKLPHHNTNGNVIWGGVVAAMSYLDRTDIPESDKREVYNHLANHYRIDFDKEPPKYDEAIDGSYTDKVDRELDIDISEHRKTYDEFNSEVSKDNTNKNNEEDDVKMAKVTIDETEFEVDEDLKEKLDGLLEEKNDEELTNVEVGEETYEVTKDAADQIEKLKGKLDGMQDTKQSLEDRLDKLEQKIDEAGATEEEVTERLKMVEEGRKYVGDSVDATMTPKEVKVEVIKAVDPNFDSEGKADGYIDGRYDGAKEALEDAGKKSLGQNNVKVNQNDGLSDELRDKKNARTNLKYN